MKLSFSYINQSDVRDIELRRYEVGRYERHCRTQGDRECGLHGKRKGVKGRERSRWDPARGKGGRGQVISLAEA